MYKMYVAPSHHRRVHDVTGICCYPSPFFYVYTLLLYTHTAVIYMYIYVMRA
jgi:hypothetical protein